MRPSIALMFVTDGRRECAERTLESFNEMLGRDVFAYTVVVDDGCSPEYSDWLDTYRWSRHVPTSTKKRGFGGAISTGWKYVLMESGCDFLFHLEDDFIVNRFFNINKMVALLERHPDLQQVALKRQPWGGDAGYENGFVEANPDSYVDHTEDDGTKWFSHRLFMTTNPSLYRVELCELGWPQGDQSEGRFHHKLISRRPDAVYGFLGHKDDLPWVQHIGEVRTGVGY